MLQVRTASRGESFAFTAFRFMAMFASQKAPASAARLPRLAPHPNYSPKFSAVGKASRAGVPRAVWWRRADLRFSVGKAVDGIAAGEDAEIAEAELKGEGLAAVAALDHVWCYFSGLLFGECGEVFAECTFRAHRFEDTVRAHGTVILPTADAVASALPEAL